MRLRRKKTVGVALGGGGARGWAHLGVLAAIEEAGIAVDFVAGTSMGALVGGIYAAGHARELREVAVQLNGRTVLYYFLDVTFPRSGIVDGKKIVDFVRKHVQETSIEGLKIPFQAVATDVLTGEEVVIKSGDLIEAVRASIAVPGMLTPVLRDGHVLVDGGLVNPVPGSVVRAMGADIVIAVDINHGRVGLGERAAAGKKKETPAKITFPETPNKYLQMVSERIAKFDLRSLPATKRWMAMNDVPNIFDILGNSLRIMEAQITESRLKNEPPDVLVRPEVGDVTFMDFDRAGATIQAGYDAAKKALQAHASLF